MSPLTTLESRLIPLLEADVDTDQIIPAQHVNAKGRQALAQALFARQRCDPAFVLNRPEMQGRSAMLVGRNFGCGSSREAAVWALAAWGIRVLVGPSFNATFYGNCLQNGLLPLRVDAKIHAGIGAALQANPDAVLAVDLPAGRAVVRDSGISFAIDLEPFARDLLIRGIDELSYLLERRALIEAYEANAGSHA